MRDEIQVIFQGAMKFTLRLPSAPPSVNRKEPFEIHCDLPKWKRVKVQITVAPERRSGDVDNRIKPVLDVLESRGMKVVYVSCRFGKENKVVIEDYSKRISA